MGFLDHEELLTQMIQLGVTPEQFVILVLLKESDFQKFYSILQEGSIFPAKKLHPQDLEDLEDKGLILNFNIEGESYLKNYIVTDKANEVLGEMNTSYLMFEELLEVYPKFTMIGGKPASLTVLDNQNELSKLYYNGIKGDVLVHKDIISKVKDLGEQGLISLGIKKFIHSKFWQNLNELKNLSGGNNSTNVYDVE